MYQAWIEAVEVDAAVLSEAAVVADLVEVVTELHIHQEAEGKFWDSS